MNSVDYDEIVRVSLYNVSRVRTGVSQPPSNLALDTALAKAIRLVCSDEWATDGNVLNYILRADGTIVGSEKAHEMMAAPGFPPI